MTHLSESEFIELAENAGALDSRRAAHVASCASCRDQLAALRSMLHQAESVEVPDPSPLFWEHMSARVRGATAAEPAPVQSGWNRIGMRGLVPLAAAAALVIAVFSGVLMLRAVRDGNTAAPGIDRTAASLVLPAPAPQDATPDEENAEVWAVLTAVASDVALEDAHAVGMHVPAAAIDHAVQDLSVAELTELGRLLQSELKRSSN